MQTEEKKENQEIPNVERENWSVKEIADESTNQSSDEILRQVLRGKEKNGKADERDIVGGVNENETPQGREESKKSLENSK